MAPLRQTTLAEIADRVPTPPYAREAVTPGVVHLGVGGFHRAHQAMYHDRLLRERQATAWGICGVGVLPRDRAMQTAMDAQDGLYTLVVKHADGTYDARVIGAITAYRFAPEDPEAVVEAIAAPTTRIVSLTITEGGYNLDHVTGEFAAADPAVAADLERGAAPRTAFGLVTEALARRRARGDGPLTVMSMDNLEGNGEVSRRAFTAFARLRDPGLGAWVAEHVAFPSSMVDRITPQTTDDDRAALRERSGVEDRWPVVCEPWTQWVLEDTFAAGRPPYEDAGVQVVEDVRPYELMKLRLLNAGHQAIAYFAYLAGHRLVHEAMADPLIVRLLRTYLAEEGRPAVPPVPGIDLDAYTDALVERFSNPEVRDTVARLCADSSDRIPKWLLPVVRHQLARDGPVRCSAAVVAAWARYAEGIDEEGRPIEVADRLRDRLSAAARRGREDPDAFVADRTVFGDLVDDDRFTSAYRWALRGLHERGARATLAALLDDAQDAVPPRRRPA